MKIKKILFVMLISLSIVSSSVVMNAQALNQSCEQCGMLCDSASQVHFRVTDENGTLHYVECMMCALKLVATYGALNITTYCDYNGPNETITVDARQYGSTVIVNPPTALLIEGGCTLNRVVRDEAAATALLASPNYGASRWLAPIQQYANGESGALNVVPANATRATLDVAALNYGGGVATPSPSTSTSPGSSPAATQQPGTTPTASLVPSSSPQVSPGTSASTTSTPASSTQVTTSPGVSPQTTSPQSTNAETSEPGTTNDNTSFVIAVVAVAAVAVAVGAVFAYWKLKRPQ